MRFSDITSAMVELWKSGQFGLQTFWPSADAVPSTGQPHARVFWITNQPEASSVGTGGLDAHTGVMQIDLMYPAGDGIGASLVKADEIAAVFVGGTIATYNTQQVHITSCGIRQPFVEGGWLRTIVSVSWIAYVARG